MEFSTKRVSKPFSTVRQNPYASEGKTYLSRFKKNRPASSIHGTPPRKLSYYSYGNNKRNESAKQGSRFKPLTFSRSNNILQNSQAQNSAKNSSGSSSKIYSRINHEENSPKPQKRVFKSLSIINTSEDPHEVWTDEETDDVFLSSKRDKNVSRDLDKENNNNINLSQTSNFYKSSPKVYSVNESVKRKPLNTLKSSILHDISPEKVQSSINPDKCLKTESKNVFKFKSFAGKENVSEKEHVSSSRIEDPHLIGFPNFGNTCYLNAVLQTLLSLNPFIVDLRTSMDSVNVSLTSITQSLWNIISARLKLDSIAVRNSLKSMKESLEKIDGSFSGFKMQDANEFLTQVLDTVKDETDRKNLSALEINNNNNSCNKFLTSPAHLDNGQAPTEPDSTESSVNPDVETNVNSKIFETPSSSSTLSLEIKVKQDSDEQLIDEEDIIFLTKRHYGTPKNKSLTPDSTTGHLPKNATPGDLLPRNELVVNPVINNFEFELFESYRCLGCGESEGRKQKHFALYVNLPLEENESIQQAVETYMSEDERDLTCNKCEHKKAAFITSFVQLPRVLIVQMKRYRYKPELSECFKVSSKVDVNLWLHLDNLISTDSKSPPKYVPKSLRDLNRNELCTPSSTSEVPFITPQKEEDPFLSPLGNSGNREPVTPKMEKETEADTAEDVDEFKDETEAKRKSDREKEEEEFQWAIKMSLQDSGMCYASEETSDTAEQCEVEPSKPEENGIGQHSYRLLSVVSHFGLTTCTGHYVSDVLNVEENQWYHYDDETVTSVSESVVLSEGRQKNGYIFFYVHQDVYEELQKSSSK